MKTLEILVFEASQGRVALADLSLPFFPFSASPKQTKQRIVRFCNIFVRGYRSPIRKNLDEAKASHVNKLPNANCSGRAQAVRFAAPDGSRRSAKSVTKCCAIRNRPNSDNSATFAALEN